MFDFAHRDDTICPLVQKIDLKSFIIFFKIRRSKQYIVGEIHDERQHAGMFKAKPFESKPQPRIETVLRQGFKQPSGAAFFDDPQVRLDIFEKENQKFIRQRVFSTVSSESPGLTSR
jgi:hypothetical protein